jgi:hypothetical protein
MSELDDHWYDMRTDGEIFAESDDAQAEWDMYHATEVEAEEALDSYVASEAEWDSFGTTADYEGWSA